MTKPLCSFPEVERNAVASKRIKAETKGLGYWAAIDYQNRNLGVTKVKKNIRPVSAPDSM